MNHISYIIKIRIKIIRKKLISELKNTYKMLDYLMKTNW